MKSQSALKHRELTQKVIGVFFEVYNELGHGFLESVYQKPSELALASKGLRVFRKIEERRRLRSAYCSTSGSRQSSKDWHLITRESITASGLLFWTLCLPLIKKSINS